MGQDLSSEIVMIRQEKAAADKRLLRYRQAAELIRDRNRKLLRCLGFPSFEALEKDILEKGVHPGGVELFRKALEGQGKILPEFIGRIPAQENRRPSKDPVQAKRERRVKFKL